jgi:hypothetical protein
LIVALKSLGEGKYQNANIKLTGIAESLSKLSENALANNDLSNLTEKGKSAIKESAPGVPAGSIICFAGTKGTRFDNGGYFYCDGRAVSRSAHSDLFEAIGETYGRGDGANTFNIPDFRGCFLRGCGGNAGTLGQKQGDAIRNIVGNASIMTRYVSGDNAFRENTTEKECYSAVDWGICNGNARYRGIPYTFFANLNFDAARVVPTANENRPINFAVHYYIKY